MEEKKNEQKIKKTDDNRDRKYDYFTNKTLNLVLLSNIENNTSLSLSNLVKTQDYVNYLAIRRQLLLNSSLNDDIDKMRSIERTRSLMMIILRDFFEIYYFFVVLRFWNNSCL